MPFNERLDLATFTKIAEMGHGFDRDDFMRDVVQPIVMAHLEEQRDAGRMGRFEGIENRSMRFPDAWNAFLAGTEAEWQYTLPNQMAHFVLIWAIDGKIKGDREDGGNEAEAIPAAYAALCERMDEGRIVKPTFMPIMTPQPAVDDIRCEATGVRCRAIIEDWRPRLERLEMQDRRGWIPLEPVEKQPAQTVEIYLPTGELLIADFIRAPGVAEAYERAVDRQMGDSRYGPAGCTSSEIGRYATTRAVLKGTGMLEISTRDVSVSVHREGESIVFTDAHDHTDDAPRVEGMTVVGEICCDRSTVVLADRSIVAKLIKDRKGRLASFLSSPDGEDVVRMDVEPGRWLVTFGEAIHAPEDAAKLGVVTTARTWFVMKRIG